ncbi:hypothetical protein AXE80_05055 [Wenyingzhuangia fucanilytica]|uniref:Uncharacterized protein n=1 Tax=Wenyingzhuangia fucanilytica TaxID=1790137 RepID=A0A1B1Y4I4_9FLAO|nr:hypothetical protein AXE80_05055 [Wenyingzhuangia fucanilytica]
MFDLFSCEQKTEIKNTRVVNDVHHNFKIKVGKNWKTELYFDDYQSRIYSADTTRNYSESFIIDITRFEGNITLSDNFRQHLMSQIKSIPRAYIIKEGFIDFKDSAAYAIYSFQKKEDIVLYNIQCYLTYPDHYFLLESKINGSQNLEKNTCESIAIFNSLTQMTKQ